MNFLIIIAFILLVSSPLATVGGIIRLPRIPRAPHIIVPPPLDKKILAPLEEVEGLPAFITDIFDAIGDPTRQKEAAEYDEEFFPIVLTYDTSEISYSAYEWKVEKIFNDGRTYLKSPRANQFCILDKDGNMRFFDETKENAVALFFKALRNSNHLNIFPCA